MAVEVQHGVDLVGQAQASGGLGQGILGQAQGLHVATQAPGPLPHLEQDLVQVPFDAGQAHVLQVGLEGLRGQPLLHQPGQVQQVLHAAQELAAVRLERGQEVRQPGRDPLGEHRREGALLGEPQLVAPGGFLCLVPEEDHGALGDGEGLHLHLGHGPVGPVDLDASLQATAGHQLRMERRPPQVRGEEHLVEQATPHASRAGSPPDPLRTPAPELDQPLPVHHHEGRGRAGQGPQDRIPQ